MTLRMQDLMSERVIMVHREDSVLNAWLLMGRERIRHLVVRDDFGIIGILSDRDVQRALRPELRVFNSQRIVETDIDPTFRVGDFMRWPVLTVLPEATVPEVAQVMIDEKVSSVLVMEERNLYGIVTHEDLLRLLTLRGADRPDLRLHRADACPS